MCVTIHSSSVERIIGLGTTTERARRKGNALRIIHNLVRVTFSPGFLFLILPQKPTDRNISHAVSSCPLTKKAHVLFQSSPGANFGEQSDTGRVFFSE